MNSFIADYRKTPAGQADKRKDEEIIRSAGAGIASNPSLSARYPDAVKDFERLNSPAPAPAPNADAGAKQVTADDLDWSAFTPGKSDSGSKRGFVGNTVTAVKRGFAGAAQGANILQGATDETNAQDIVDYEKIKRANPPSKEFQAFMDAEGFTDSALAFVKNPVRIVTEVIAESAAQMVPSIALGAAGGAIGGAVSSAPTGGAAAPATVPIGVVVGSAVGAGAGSGLAEYGSAIMDAMQKAGMDATDPASVISFFSDEKKVAAAREHAIKRAVPIALFDAVSFGLAGKFAKPLKVAMQSGEKVGAKRVLAASAKEIGMQAATGASGEATAQLASEGEITDGKSIFLEGIAEVGSAPLEVASNLREFGRTPTPPQAQTAQQARAIEARRRAVDGTPQAARPAPARDRNALSPTARAAQLVQADPQGASDRLGVLTALTNPTPDEVTERDVLSRLVRVQTPPSRPAFENTVNVQNPDNPEQIATVRFTGATQAEADEKARAFFGEVPTDANGNVTREVQVEMWKRAQAQSSDVAQPVEQPSPKGPVAGSTPAVAANPQPPQPIVKPSTAGELRVRVQKANNLVERAFKAVPGIQPGDALSTVQKEIAAGTFTDETVTRLEQAVAELQTRSVAVAQARALESQQQQTDRAKAKAEKARAAQEKKNAAALEKLAKQLRKDQAAAFRKDPVTAVAELRAERDLIASSGADTKDIEARIAEFTAKLPKAPAPAEQVAETVRAELVAADQARVTPATAPAATPAPLEFGEIALAGRDALGGFDLEGFAVGLGEYARRGQLTPEIADAMTTRLETELADLEKKKRANKQGGIYSVDGNASKTRTAMALQLPDGSVVLAGILPPRKVAVLGETGEKESGIRVVRMATRAPSPKGKKKTPKAIKVDGSSPVLLRDLLRNGIYPVNVVQFNAEPGTPLQTFPSRAAFEESLAITPRQAKSAATVGGDNRFATGGAGVTDAGNMDAAQIAEAQQAAAAQQTTETEEEIREDAALSWRDGREYVVEPGVTVDMPLNLFSQIEKAGGKMTVARERMGKSRAKTASLLIEWLAETTEGLDNADLAIERMYQDAAGSSESFAELGGEAASWVASASDNRNLALPAANETPAIENTPAPVQAPVIEDTKPSAPKQDAFQAITLGLWGVIVTKAEGDVDAAAGILERGKGTIKVGKAKVNLSDIRDALMDRGIGLTEITAAYDAAPDGDGGFEAFEEALRNPAARERRVDNGDILLADAERNAKEAAEISRASGGPIYSPPKGQRENPEAARARSKHNQKLRETQAARLKEWAQSRGLLLDAAGFESRWQAFQERLRKADPEASAGGQEHDVYYDGNGRWWKRNRIDSMHLTYDEYLDRIIAHNQLFPESALRFEGFVEHDGMLWPVVSQPDIRASRGATPEEVAAYMATLGFRPETDLDYVNDQGIRIEDLHDENAVISGGHVVIIDPAIFVPAKRAREVGPRALTPTAQSEQNANTQAAVTRIAARLGITTERVAQPIIRQAGPDGSVRIAVGKTVSAQHIVVAMDDVAFNSMNGLVTLVHEAGHARFSQLPIGTQASLTRAVASSMDKVRARALVASKTTGVKVASNFNLNPEEALVETTAQELAAQGIPDAPDAAAAVWRMVKDIYLRGARAVLELVNAPQAKIDALSLAWWDNNLRRTLGGDFEWSFINVVDRFLPSSPAQRVAAMENPDYSTPGNLAEFIDPLTGVMSNPADARFREEAAPGLDLDRQVAWDRLEGAAFNEVIPSLERAHKEAAPGMDLKKFWKLIGKGDLPTLIRDQLETRTPGASTAAIGGDGMTKAMNERAAERALRRVKLLGNILSSRITGRTERINKAADQLLAQSDKTAKMEAEYRNAGVLEDALRTRLQDMTRQAIRAVDQGMDLATEAGQLGEAIANVESLLAGEAIPESYQQILRSIMDGQISVFDHLSAISKLGLNLPAMTIQQAQTAIRAAAPTDTRLAALVANRPLFTTLTALARTSAREMGLLQLRQMNNASESLAIKQELEQIRTASVERLEKMWQESQELADQSSLAARLRKAYLTERRTLRRIERTIAESSKDLTVLETTREILAEKQTDLEKRVGNFSAWHPVKGATWLAMKPAANGSWQAVDRTLTFDDTDRVTDVGRVRDDLAGNKRYLEDNPDLAGTETYERVKRQTYEITKLNLDRTNLAAHRWWLVDALFPDLGTKFAQTGTSGGDLLRQQMRRFGEIVKFNQVRIDPLAHKWSAALKSLYGEAGAGFENYNDFFKRVIVPTIYKVESETGRDEAAALRDARAYARARVQSPTAKFDARLEDFLRRTKETSELMLEIAEANGVFVADPRLGNQLRRAIAYGWMTVPRSLDMGVVAALTKDMAQAGWSVEWTETTRNDANGQPIITRRVAKGNTFDGLDLEAPDLADQLAAKFTPDIVDRFLEPFIRKPGKPVFYTPAGVGIDSLAVENAWTESGGDVLAWIDLLGETTGALEQLATREDATTPPHVEWRRMMLGRIDGLWTMEMRLANQTSVVSKMFDPNAPKAHNLMDARLNDDIPPEHLTYAYFDPVQASNRLAEIAFHSAFGRNGDSANAALLSMQAEIDNRAILRDTIWKEHKTKAARSAAAKAAGYDYNTLNRSTKDKRRVREWEKAFRSLFAPGGRAGVVDDISAGQELLRLNQLLILNQPTSGLWNLLSATDFPIVFRGAGKTARAATARAVRNLFVEGFGSLFQDLGWNIQRGSTYARDIGQMIDGRRMNNLEWGVRLSDVGSRGQYGDASLSDGFIDWASARAKQGIRKVTAVLDKGVTPGDLMRRGRAAEGDFGRFSLLTSPFKFLNDTASKAVAVSNVQTFEQVVRKGIDFMADNPEAMTDPDFRFTPEDLGMGSDGMFGDKGAFDFYRTKSVEYGLGTVEDMVRSAVVRKERGEALLTRDQAISIGIMALNEVAMEASINSRPVEMFTNPAVRLATPLLGWPIAKMNQVNQMLKTSEGQFAWSAAMRGLSVMALIAVPMGVAFSLGMDEWDERVRGKKSQLPEIGLDKTTRQNVVGIFARIARAGNVYGLGADVAFGLLGAPLDPGSGQRQFTLDSRVLAYSQVKGVFDALKALPMQDWQMTWASGGRQLLLSMGGNGPLQYVQILNQMGANVSEAESRVIARQNVYASIRQAAVNAGIPVRKSGGAVAPNPSSMWLREMQMAAFAGERLAFRDAYLKAIEVERAAGEADPADQVRRRWRTRNPFRVLENPPSDLEMQKIYGAMDDLGRRTVQEAMRNYATFTALIEPTPLERAQARARRVVSPEDRMAARRRAMGY